MLIGNPKNKPKTAFIIGDTHDPWVDKKLLQVCYDRIADMQPDYVIQMGDRYDFYCFSSHPGPDFISSADEIQKGREDAERFWRTVHKVAPKAERIQLWGNHDSRFMKRIFDRMPKAAPFLERLDYKSFWRFPGVLLQEDERDEVKIDFGGRVGQVWFLHGYSSARAYHALYNLENTVTAHTHRAEITWIPRRGRNIFEMNVGYVASQDSPVMRYTPQRYSKSVAGYGIIDKDGPRVVTFG